MKKINLSSAVFACAAISVAHAGGVGPTMPRSPVIPFASLEAAYTWSKIDAVSINNYSASMNKEQWGGRFALGANYSFSEKLSLEGELGGGYYGNADTTISEVSTTTNNSIDGYDLLLGGMYSLNQFDLFFKVGVMVENFRVKLTQNNASATPGGLFNGTTTQKFNQTQGLPEIKVGGIYNFNKNLGVSLAYMHVFGSNMGISVTQFATPSSITLNSVSNIQNPTLDSIMFGLRYSMC